MSAPTEPLADRSPTMPTTTTRDPMRERDLDELCMHPTEVRHTGAGRVTVTIELADLDALAGAARRYEQGGW